MSRRPLSRRAARVGLAAATLVLSACARNTPQDALDPAGPYARKLQNLFVPVLIVAAVIFVLVQFGVIYSVVRFRARRDDESPPPQTHGNTKLEIGWTIVPAVILAGVAILTVTTIFDLAEEPGPDALRVNVVGKQWWWEYEYPDLGFTTANELHIPTDRPVRLDMTSTDVVHSFWPPRLAGKVDVLPGRSNKMTIQADQPGTYLGQCAEFCGLSHANMRLRVIAHDAAGFDDWAGAQARPPAQPAGGPAASGAQLFRTKGCGGCHTIKGVSGGTVGPDLTHFASREVFAGAIFENDERSLRRWLRDPPAEKPGSLMPILNLTEDEITQLVAYLQSLK